MGLKLLFIGHEIRTRDAITNFSGVWSFYLANELRAMGHEIVFTPRPKLGEEMEWRKRVPLDGIDHVLALGQRWFEKTNHMVGETLINRFEGSVSQCADGPRSKTEAFHNTFTVRGRATGNAAVGWAADPNLCVSNQGNGISILIDHPYYGEAAADRSKEILGQVRGFQQRQHGVEVRCVYDGVVGAPDTENPGARGRVPYEDMCREYSKAHVFMVTHRESVGLTALECAMAGALVVAPRGYIHKELLQTISHIEYPGAIPWTQVLQGINPTICRAKALRNSWASVAAKMVCWWMDFSRD